jgi:hypothetical protein
LVGHLFLINQSLYQEILLLQKFNDIGGKILKPKKISLQPQKKIDAIFLFYFFKNWDFDLEISQLRKKFSCQPQKCKLVLYMSNGSEVLIYLSFLLFLKEAVF